MDLLKEVQGFADRSGRAATVNDLELLLDQVSRDLGFDHYALIHHVDHRTVRGASIRLENYPSGWVNTFLERELYAWDPIHVASHKTNMAFAWSDVPNMIDLTKKQREVLEAAAREGIGDGFTVPANVPGEANGSCSFAMRVGRDLPRDRYPAVQLIGAFAFQAARKLAIEAFPAVNPLRRTPLSPRQLDCVLLAGRGKSDWEIATILGLKEDTVTEYIDAARRSYGVAKRVQLVLRAVHDGQLALTDLV